MKVSCELQTYEGKGLSLKKNSIMLVQDVDDEYGCFSSKDETFVAQIKKALRNR